MVGIPPIGPLPRPVVLLQSESTEPGNIHWHIGMPASLNRFGLSISFFLLSVPGQSFYRNQSRQSQVTFIGILACLLAWTAWTLSLSLSLVSHCLSLSLSLSLSLPLSRSLSRSLYLSIALFFQHTTAGFQEGLSTNKICRKDLFELHTTIVLSIHVTQQFRARTE